MRMIISYFDTNHVVSEHRFFSLYMSMPESVEETKNPGFRSDALRSRHSFRDISIWLDSYDDIFSDFDPREYSERNISDDFLYEVKKVARESNYHIQELKLLIPEKNRNREQENIIIKRLGAHFRKNYRHFSDKRKAENKKGILFALAGMMLMTGASYISLLKSDNIFMHILLVMLEPSGWFLIWVGLDKLVYVSPEHKPEQDFYKKMSKSRISFVSI